MQYAIEVASSLQEMGDSLFNGRNNAARRDKPRIMTFGRDDEPGKDPVLSLATAVALSGARGGCVRVLKGISKLCVGDVARGGWRESEPTSSEPEENSTASLHCLLLPIPERSTSGVLLWHKTGVHCQPRRSARSHLCFHPPRCQSTK